MEDQEKLPSDSEEQEDPGLSPVDIAESLEPALDLTKDTSPGAPPEVGSPEVFVPEEALAPKKSKGERFMAFIRKIVIWILVFSLVYLAGVVTIHELAFQPAKDALEQTQQDLEDANATIADQLVELEEAYFDLSYNAFLEVLSDVYAARLALMVDDTLGAKAGLATTEAQLELILDKVAAFDQALADSLPQRLNLILTNIDADIERSILDAELFTEDLIKVYQGVYAQN